MAKKVSVKQHVEDGAVVREKTIDKSKPGKTVARTVRKKTAEATGAKDVTRTKVARKTNPQSK